MKLTGQTYQPTEATLQVIPEPGERVPAITATVTQSIHWPEKGVRVTVEMPATVLSA